MKELFQDKKLIGKNVAKKQKMNILDKGKMLKDSFFYASLMKDISEAWKKMIFSKKGKIQ